MASVESSERWGGQRPLPVPSIPSSMFPFSNRSLWLQPSPSRGHISQSCAYFSEAIWQYAALGRGMTWTISNPFLEGKTTWIGALLSLWGGLRVSQQLIPCRGAFTGGCNGAVVIGWLCHGASKHVLIAPVNRDSWEDVPAETDWLELQNSRHIVGSCGSRC